MTQTANKFRRTQPEFSAAVGIVDAACERVGHKALDGEYLGDPAVAAALDDVAFYAWKDVLAVLEPALNDQDDRDAVQVMIFGHDIVSQMMALFVANILMLRDEHISMIKNVVLGETDVLVVDKKKAAHVTH